MISLVTTTNTVLVTLFGFLLNFLTIWMVSRHTQQEMRIYSRILLQSCVTDLIAICIYVLVQPVFFSDKNVGTVWSYGPVHMLPNPWQCLCFLFFVFMSRFSTTSVSSLFLYRYLVVNRKVTMTIRRYACLLSMVTIPVAVLAGSSFCANLPAPSNEHLSNQAIAHILGLDNRTLEKYVVTLRANSENGGSNFTSSFAMTLSLGSYLIVLFCGISIQLHIRRRYRGPSMVVKRRVNHQITVVLVAQAILPMLNLLPSLTTNSIIRFKLSKGALVYVGMFSTLPVSWVFVLNPLATLLSVQNYRETLRKMAISFLSSRKALKDKLFRRQNKNTSSDEILEETDGSETLL